MQRRAFPRAFLSTESSLVTRHSPSIPPARMMPTYLTASRPTANPIPPVSQLANLSGGLFCHLYVRPYPLIRRSTAQQLIRRSTRTLSPIRSHTRPLTYSPHRPQAYRSNIIRFRWVERNIQIERRVAALNYISAI